MDTYIHNGYVRTRCTAGLQLCVFALQALKRFGAPLHDPDVDGNTPGELTGARVPGVQTYVYMWTMVASAPYKHTNIHTYIRMYICTYAYVHVEESDFEMV